MKFILTVDTEADNQWDQKQTKVTLQNLKALPRFQDYMESLGIPPTYFVSYEVWSDTATARYLAQKHKGRKAEVGGHLHPWTTPPYSALDGAVQRFPLELPDTELEHKLESLTSTITNHLDEAPVSFRAGRWGFSDRVARALVANGYKIDSSITPGINWGAIVRDRKSHTRMPDFRNESVMPSRRAGMLEVPMTIIPTGIVRNGFVTRMAHERTLLGKAARALARPTWCRIFPETQVSDLVRVYQSARKQQLPALVFMIHSSELAPGMSPYTKTQEAVDRVYRILHSFSEYLIERSVEPVRLRDLIGAI